jgi:hypothetical protein
MSTRLFEQKVWKVWHALIDNYVLCNPPDFSCNLSAKVCSLRTQGCQMVCFQNKNPNFGKILEGLRMENAGLFYGHLEYFAVIWYILWPFGNVVVIWYTYLPSFWYISCVKKNLATRIGVNNRTKSSKDRTELMPRLGLLNYSLYLQAGIF